MIAFCQKIVDSDRFRYPILALIVLNALTFGLETYPEITAKYGNVLWTFQTVVIYIFIAEFAIKFIAVAPNFKKFFQNRWDLFDFLVVVVSVLPESEYLLVARVIRLFRVLRLITVLRELRVVTSAFVHSLPAVGNVLLLLAVIFYVFAIFGHYLFKENDPFHWHSLGMSLNTLYRVLTLEDWTDVMYTAMEVYPHAWIYFMVFVVICSFIVVNMLIAILVNNIDRSSSWEFEQNGGTDTKFILFELKETNMQLEKIEQSLNLDDVNRLK